MAKLIKLTVYTGKGENVEHAYFNTDRIIKVRDSVRGEGEKGKSQITYDNVDRILKLSVKESSIKIYDLTK